MVVLGNAGPRLRVQGGEDGEEVEQSNIDEKKWRDDCVDLHRVMTVSQALYLVLEHHNEALLRVCTEIVTCRKSKKCLWWQMGWYDDDAKREWLKQLVKDKVNAAIAVAKGSAVDVQELDDVGNAEEIERLKKKLAEAEAALQRSRQNEDMLEQKLRELREALDAANARANELEKACDALREELKRTKDEAQALKAALDEATSQLKTGDKSNLTEQMAESERRRKQAEEALKKMEEKLAEMKAQMKLHEQRQAVLEAADEWFNKIFRSNLCKDLKISTGKDVHVDEASRNLESFTKKYRDLEQKAKEGGKPVVVNRPEKETKKDDTPAASDRSEKPLKNQGDGDSEALRELQKQLQAAEKRNQELEENNGKLKDQVDMLKDEVELLKKQLDREKTARLEAEALIAKLQSMGNQGAQPTPQAKVTTDDGDKNDFDPALMEELKELRKMKADFEKMQGRNKALVKKNKELNEEKEEMQEQIDKLLKLLAQVKEQLRRIMEIAEKKGLGAQVKEIMDEANLTETLNSPEFTCFDRLYEDALRRQRRAREIERMKLGLDPRGPDIRRVGADGAEVLRRGANGIIGYGSDYGGSGMQYGYGGPQFYMDSASEYSGYSRAGSRSRSASPMPGMYGFPSRSGDRVCECGNVLFDDSVYCRKCGKKWEETERSRSPGEQRLGALRLGLGSRGSSREKEKDAEKTRERAITQLQEKKMTPQSSVERLADGTISSSPPAPSRQLMPPGPLDLAPPSAVPAVTSVSGQRRDVWTGMNGLGGFTDVRRASASDGFQLATLGGVGGGLQHSSSATGFERRTQPVGTGLRPLKGLQSSASETELPKLGVDGPRRVLIQSMDVGDARHEVHRGGRQVQVLTNPDQLRTGPGAMRGHYFSTRHALGPRGRDDSPPRGLDSRNTSGSTPDLMVGKRAAFGPGASSLGGSGVASGWAVTNNRVAGSGIPSLGQLARADVSGLQR